jgi:hypothetical protein
MPARALHFESQPATRLTFGPSHTHTSGRQWSTRALAFSSEADLLGNGSTGRQLFVFDLLSYDCNNGTTMPATTTTQCPLAPRAPLRQLTFGPGSPDNPSLVFNTVNMKVAFDADDSFIGGDTGHRQVYLMDIITGEIVQVTDSPDGDSVHPTINDRGNIVAFESTAPLAGVRGDEGVVQVFVYWRQWNLKIAHLVQLTAGHAPSTAPSLAAPSPERGFSMIAFQSAADLLGDGHDTGVSQVFLGTVDWLYDQVASLTQLTSGNAPSIRPQLDAKRDFVAFESEATNFAGTSGGPGPEIYAVLTTQGNLPPVHQLTTFDPYGNCRFPAVGDTGDRVAFICTGDPLHNDTMGNRAFVLTLDRDKDGLAPSTTLEQITGRGDVKGPVGMYMGRHFLTLADNTDLTGEGICGDQLFIVDFNPFFWHAPLQEGDIPDDMTPPPPPPSDSTLLGNHTFAVKAGTESSGSQLSVTTSDANTTTGITTNGNLRLEMGARNVVDQAATVKVAIEREATVLPPVSVPGLGIVCLTPTAAGSGVIDCDGGRTDTDITLQQFHGPDPANPSCLGGCIESRTSTTCRGPHVGLCRGPITMTPSGTFLPGGMRLTLPVAVGISTFEGFDGIACTLDDTYLVNNLPIQLNFTTGTLTATVMGIDAGSGNRTHTDTGVPFDCSRVITGDLVGATLVTALPLLDLLNVNGTSRDVLLAYRLETSSHGLQGTCDPNVCAVDTDCESTDPAAPPQTCLNLTCGIGAPVCDDGNHCNGIETTDPVTGACSPGTPPECDDGNLCTTDSCNPTVGCVHADACSNGNACDGAEMCDPTTGACSPGTPPECDDGNLCTTDSCDQATGCVHADACSDGNACNGAETCDPTTGVCGPPGTAPDCDDGNLCTTDSCDQATGCVHIDNTNPCDDGTLCTVNDVCEDGVCRGTDQPCGDGDVCNGVEVCDPTTGICNLGDSLVGQEFLGCELAHLDAMLEAATDEVEGAPPAAFGGISRRKSLLKKILTTQTKLRTLAFSTGDKRLRMKLKAATLRLSRLSGTIQKGIRAGRIDQDSGATLIAAISDMVAILDTLRQQVSVP